MENNIYEIYTKNPETNESGWDIVWVRSTDSLIKTFPNFDVIITKNDYPTLTPYKQPTIVEWLGETS